MQGPREGEYPFVRSLLQGESLTTALEWNHVWNLFLP